MAKCKIAVYIGRFQPLHKGHEYVLQHCMNNYDHTIVLIGSAFKARDTENPLTYDERYTLVDNWRNLHSPSQFWSIYPLRDQPYNNAKWIQSVQEIVAAKLAELGEFGLGADVTVIGSDRDASTWYLRTFPQWGLDLIDPHPNFDGLSATQIRKRLFDGLDHHKWPELSAPTKAFFDEWRAQSAYYKLIEEYEDNLRYKAQWRGPYPPSFQTVDAVVVQSGHILVVERAKMPGKGLIALPGGFVEANQTMMQAMLAEVTGETGIRFTDGKRALEVTKSMLEGSVVAQRNFDHPKRSLRGRTFTNAYLIRLDDSKPLPKVGGQLVPIGEPGGGRVQETARAFWMPISEARAKSEIWFEDHHAIVDTMVGLIKD